MLALWGRYMCMQVYAHVNSQIRIYGLSKDDTSQFVKNVYSLLGMHKLY